MRPQGVEPSLFMVVCQLVVAWKPSLPTGPAPVVPHCVGL